MHRSLLLGFAATFALATASHAAPPAGSAALEAAFDAQVSAAWRTALGAAPTAEEVAE